RVDPELNSHEFSYSLSILARPSSSRIPRNRFRWTAALPQVTRRSSLESVREVHRPGQWSGGILMALRTLSDYRRLLVALLVLALAVNCCAQDPADLSRQPRVLDRPLDPETRPKSPRIIVLPDVT